MIIEMNDNDKFDVNLSSISAKINDQNLFHKSEIQTINNVNKFISTTHEFKNQPSTLLTGNFYVEYKMLVKGKEHYSGIETSEAELQTYSVGEMLFTFPTNFIRWCYKNRSSLILDDKDKNDTDYIASGFLIPLHRINELYSKYYQQKRLKELYINKKV